MSFKPTAIVFRVLVALSCFLSISSSADEALWTADLVHYEPGRDEWVIRPAVEPAKPQRLADVLKTISSKDPKLGIRHISLNTLFKRADLQSEVVAYLQKQKEFQKSPPPFGQSRWDFDNSGEIQKLVSDALMRSTFVVSLNRELASYNLKITSTNMEKLYFTKEDQKINWYGIVWLKLTPSK